MNEVEIKNIDMPFWSMTRFMIKWTVASIPAMLIMSFVGMMLVFLSTLVLSVVAG